MSGRRGGAPPIKEGGPAVTSKATITRTAKSSRHRRQNGYAAPSGADRAEAELLDQAELMGFRLAVQCVRCRQWLVAEDSVRHHLGPVCRQRAGVVA